MSTMMGFGQMGAMGAPVPGMAQGLPGNMFAQHLPPMHGMGGGYMHQSPSYVPPPITTSAGLGATMPSFGFGGLMPYTPSYVPPVSYGQPVTAAPVAAAPVTTSASAPVASGSPLPEAAPAAAPAAAPVRYAAPAAQTYSGFPQMGFGGYGGFGGGFPMPAMPPMPPMPPVPAMPAFAGLPGFGAPVGHFGQPAYGAPTYGSPYGSTYGSTYGQPVTYTAAATKTAPAADTN